MDVQQLKANIYRHCSYQVHQIMELDKITRQLYPALDKLEEVKKQRMKENPDLAYLYWVYKGNAQILNYAKGSDEIYDVKLIDNNKLKIWFRDMLDRHSEIGSTFIIPLEALKDMGTTINWFNNQIDNILNNI